MATADKLVEVTSTVVRPAKKMETWVDTVPDPLARRVLMAAGERLAEHARRKLRDSGKSVSGRTEKSIVASSPKKDSHGYWKTLVGPKAKHAVYIIKGRRPNSRMPPVSAILKWIRARGIIPRQEGNRKISQKSLAWAIAKSIAKKGIKPFPFMTASFIELRDQLKRQIKTDLAKGLKGNL